MEQPLPLEEAALKVPSEVTRVEGVAPWVKDVNELPKWSVVNAPVPCQVREHSYFGAELAPNSSLGQLKRFHEQVKRASSSYEVINNKEESIHFAYVLDPKTRERHKVFVCHQIPPEQARSRLSILAQANWLANMAKSVIQHQASVKRGRHHVGSGVLHQFEMRFARHPDYSQTEHVNRYVLKTTTTAEVEKELQDTTHDYIIAISDYLREEFSLHYSDMARNYTRSGLGKSSLPGGNVLTTGSITQDYSSQVHRDLEDIGPSVIAWDTTEPRASDESLVQIVINELCIILEPRAGTVLIMNTALQHATLRLSTMTSVLGVAVHQKNVIRAATRASQQYAAYGYYPSKVEWGVELFPQPDGNVITRYNKRRRT